MRSHAIKALMLLLAFQARYLIPESRAFEQSGFFITFHAEDRLVCCGLIRLSASEYLLLGRVDSLKGESSPWAAKVTDNGRVEWERRYNLSAHSAAFLAGARASDDVAYAVGSQGQSPLITRLSSGGSVVWSKTPLSDLDGRATAAMVNRNGTLTIAGVSHVGARRVETSFVSQIDTAGNLVWRRDLGPDSHVASVLGLRMGGYIVGGWSNLVRLDPDGAVLWRHRVEGLFRVIETRDGSFLIGESLTRTARSGIVLSALLPTGQLRWRREFADDKWCGAAGLWESTRGTVIASGDLCDEVSQLWIAEFSLDGARLTAEAVAIRNGTNILSILPGPLGHIVAAGMFNQNLPEARKAWIYMSPPLKPLLAR